MADTSRIVDRVAARFVNRLTGPLEAALRRPGGRLSEAEAALERGAAAAERLVSQAVEEQDMRLLATREPMEERLLDVAEESANATRCAVRPTATPTGRLSVDANAQMQAEASVSAVRAMVGTDTVPVTADLKRAIDTTPVRRVAHRPPTVVEVEQAVREAARVATFDATAPKVRQLFIADLRPNGALAADSELVVRYRSGLPVPPVVVNEEGVILDGKTRAASAWAAGLDKIDAVVVRSDDGAMAMEWLRWNN